MSRMLCLVVLIAAAGFGPPSAAVEGAAFLRDRPLADAVVWLEAPDAPPTTGHARVVLDQRDMTFIPHVLVVRTGTVVTFPNDDRVFHDVFSDHDGKKFSLGLYPVGTVRQVPFDEPGLSRIYCHIHPQMAAYVMVVDSPYFAVSDAQGRFTLPPAPVGAYRYHAWRPGGATLEADVSVGAGARLQVRWP